MLFTLVLVFFFGLLLASLAVVYLLAEDDFWVIRRPSIFGRDRTEERPQRAPTIEAPQPMPPRAR